MTVAGLKTAPQDSPKDYGYVGFTLRVGLNPPLYYASVFELNSREIYNETQNGPYVMTSNLVQGQLIDIYIVHKDTGFAYTWTTDLPTFRTVRNVHFATPNQAFWFGGAATFVAFPENTLYSSDATPLARLDVYLRNNTLYQLALVGDMFRPTEDTFPYTFRLFPPHLDATALHESGCTGCPSYIVGQGPPYVDTFQLNEATSPPKLNVNAPTMYNEDDEYNAEGSNSAAGGRRVAHILFWSLATGVYL
jgi:hypothetical protein